LIILNFVVKYGSQDLDAVFRALADPVRRQIVEELKEGEKTVSQMHSHADMSLVAFMKHIETLESSGIISTQKLGRSRVCRFEPDRLRLAESWLSETRTFWTSALRQLNDRLTEPPQDEQP
jgi:DNA-binding transcriptional ArsR family regulator